MAFRLMLYLAFVLIAAPFEIVLDLWGGVVRPDPQLILRPLAEGLVYLYALTLIVETSFRIQQKPAKIRTSPWLKWLNPVSFVLVLALMSDYLSEVRPRLLLGQPVLDTVNRQVVALVLALGCSIVSFAILERRTKRVTR